MYTYNSIKPVLSGIQPVPTNQFRHVQQLVEALTALLEMFH